MGFKEQNLKLYEEKVGVVEVLPSASFLSYCGVAERRYLHKKVNIAAVELTKLIAWHLFPMIRCCSRYNPF